MRVMDVNRNENLLFLQNIEFPCPSLDIVIGIDVIFKKLRHEERVEVMGGQFLLCVIVTVVTVVVTIVIITVVTTIAVVAIGIVLVFFHLIKMHAM